MQQVPERFIPGHVGASCNPVTAHSTNECPDGAVQVRVDADKQSITPDRGLTNLLNTWQKIYMFPRLLFAYEIQDNSWTTSDSGSSHEPFVGDGIFIGLKALKS